MNPKNHRLAMLAAALTGLVVLALGGCSSKRSVGVAGPIVLSSPPDSWFAGPDPNDPSAGWLTATGPFGGKYIDLGATGWERFAGIPHSMLSRDSLLLLPAARRQRQTFFEAYNDRLWLRQEGDTVHLNSWVIFPAGGFDLDSPYSVRVDTASLSEPLRGTPVLTPAGLNGSPIGFRLIVQVKDAAGQVSLPSETTTFPVFDPTSVFHNPIINGYWGLTVAGKAYAVVRAEDGDGTVDRRLDQRPGGAVGVADRVDAGAGSGEDQALRSKILTFYVNHPPVLLTQDPRFRPRAGAVITNRTAIDWNMPGRDDDKLDPLAGSNRVGGTPGGPPILRRKLAIFGKSNDTGRDTCFIVQDGSGHVANFFQDLIGTIVIPSWLANGPITLRVRLCDCFQCDALPGTPTCPFAGGEAFPSQGTCVDKDIPCQLQTPEPQAIVAAGPDATHRAAPVAAPNRRPQ